MELPSDIESCHAIIREQSKQIEQLLGVVSDLKSRIQQLEQQLSKDSHHSNKPPSSDGLRKRIVKSALLKKGGQKGKRLDMVSTPNEVISLLPTQCSCGYKLTDSALHTSFLKETRLSL